MIHATDCRAVCYLNRAVLLTRPAPSVRILAELAVSAALATVLSLFRVKLPHLLYGGSVSLHLVPLFAVALRRGLRPGMAAGAAYGLLNFLITPFYVHPLQVLLDYPLAFGTVGLAALPRAVGLRQQTVVSVLGVLIGSAGRLAAHFVSGLAYFSHLAPRGAPVWQYSLVYNASYVVPEAILCAVLMPLIIRRIGGAHPPPDATPTAAPGARHGRRSP